MPPAPRNLFEAATARGRVIRQGEIACIIMDGAGAMVVMQQELLGAQKWAQSRLPSANLLSDRARFLDQFSALVARPGSLQATRGNDRQLERLARAMLAAGYDLAEWVLPVELKDIGRGPAPTAPQRDAQGGATHDGATPEGEASDPAQPE